MPLDLNRIRRARPTTLPLYGLLFRAGIRQADAAAALGIGRQKFNALLHGRYPCPPPPELKAQLAALEAQLRDELGVGDDHA